MTFVCSVSPESEMLWANIALVIVTFALVVVTGFYVCLTRKLVQSQTDPCVIAYLQRNRECGEVVDIAIENIGKGIARDVQLEPSKNPEDAKKWQQILNGESCTSGFRDIIKRGIPVLLPGEKKVIRWCRNEHISLGFYVGSSVIGLFVICRCKRFEQGRKSEVEPMHCFFDVMFDTDWKSE